MTDTPEDWVLIEAGKKCGWHISLDQLQYEYHNEEVFRALCDMIAKHEQKPVDRKVLCAREADRLGRLKTEHSEWIAIRAIELYLEGFGE